MDKHVVILAGPSLGSPQWIIWFQFGTGFTLDALPATSLIFNPGLGPALRCNCSVAGLASCLGINPRPR